MRRRDGDQDVDLAGKAEEMEQEGRFVTFVRSTNARVMAGFG